MSNQVTELQMRLRRFAEERDWVQFHSPKNLAAAPMVEAGELLEHFQCLTDEQSRNLSPDAKEQVAQEIADVLIYLLQLSSALGIEPLDAADKKVEANAEKYPVSLARGRITKYTEL